jgi:hypothetical protein
MFEKLKSIAKQAGGYAATVVLTSVIASGIVLFNGYVVKGPDPLPPPAPVIDVDVESWAVYDTKGTRITDANIEKAFSAVEIGTFYADGRAKPGKKGKRFKVTVENDGPTTTPVVIDPNKPPVVNPNTPPVETPVIPFPSKTDRVTYVYEKDDGTPPPAVAKAIDTLHRQGITATIFEEDATDGTGQTPDQYKIAVDAARKSGLPSLVVQAGQVVKSTVKVTTEQQVLEAAK